MILGMNGYIWVQAPSANVNSAKDTSMATDDRGESSASMAIYSSRNDSITTTTRAAIDRVAVCVRILAIYWAPITDVKVMEAYEASLAITGENGDEMETDQLLQEEAQAAIIAAIVAKYD